MISWGGFPVTRNRGFLLLLLSSIQTVMKILLDEGLTHSTGTPIQLRNLNVEANWHVYVLVCGAVPVMHRYSDLVLALHGIEGYSALRPIVC